MVTETSNITHHHKAADEAHADAYKALTKMIAEYDALASILYATDADERVYHAVQRLSAAAREARYTIGAI